MEIARGRGARWRPETTIGARWRPKTATGARWRPETTGDARWRSQATYKGAENQQMPSGHKVN